MANELDVLRIVSERLVAAEIAFMLTGSYALAYYATPRMTRDLDLVVELGEKDVGRLVGLFSSDFYIDADDARAAIRSERLFNLMHLESGIKVDFIVRKRAEYRQVEFSRRLAVDFGGVRTWVTSREDLILSKLLWARDADSELQRRDVRALLDGPVDRQKDTSPSVAAMVAERHRQMTAEQRWQAAAEMFETARSIVEASLPLNIGRRERRLAWARRVYGRELPEAALIAHADFM